ncbi:MAG TPA: VOC family protein [Solirubrobacteraceae bacterium]|nr:VOC family protein [Solirubrobacteraceae bacterium]
MTDPVPAHLTTVTPRLVVADGLAAIDFYRRAFGAEERGDRFITPDGAVIHAEIRIGDAIVMITEEPVDTEAPARPPAAAGAVVTAIMETYWPNVDAAWERALSAGAEVIFPLEDQFYGDRAGRIRDPFGHQWILSQRLRELSPADLRP